MNDETPTVLCIDDEDMIRQSIGDYLEDSGYRVLQANNGRTGLEVFRADPPDIILVDLRMPEMDGLEVLSHVTKEAPEVPILVVSGTGVLEDSIEALRRGAWDYVTKPIEDMAVLAHSMDKALERARLRRENRLYHEHLEREVQRRTAQLKTEMLERIRAEKELAQQRQEILETQKEFIFLLGGVVETRSKETANHVRRMAEFTYLLAKGCGLDDEEARMVRMIAPMHDVGKIGIPDSILLKPGRLTPEEYEVIKTHTNIGYTILSVSPKRIMRAAAIMAYQHHERWNGSGYPQGLVGEGIHLYGRIGAMADVFDALLSKRVYKEPWSMSRITDYFAEHKGSMFDPQLVEVFMSLRDDLLAVREAYPDDSDEAVFLKPSASNNSNS
ncbi:putative two-component system response regulator [Desulfobaculum xiamenense]|uniref:Putative two-component system response regulator n=1 Tax=Desulfobaculum xiamenense TaxID=995050 RepID=A0A846QTB2_9BACT|nr:HD domain-containing phosphohydrolase [Desulfobaculum xiamenense]NJB68414.1 putative two-component system response regulator [Desulfobaculum xiamenense]